MSTKVFVHEVTTPASPPPPPEHPGFEAFILYALGTLIGYVLWSAKAITEFFWHVHR